MSRLILVLRLAAVAAYLTASSASAEPMFMGLGRLLDHGGYSGAKATSADGTVVVGFSGAEAMRWQDGVMTGISDGMGIANGVSADGTVVVGNKGSEAFRWEDGILTTLGFLSPDSRGSQAEAVSANGLVVVGFNLFPSAGDHEAFRWENGIMEGLGDQNADAFFAHAFAVSADGTVIVGHGTTSVGQTAVRWQNGELLTLDPLPGESGSSALDLTPDGSVVVGSSVSVPGGTLRREAVRWGSTGVLGLGDLPGGDFRSQALAVSGNGSIVVGRGETSLGEEAFIWDSKNGIRRLQDVLAAEYGLDLSGWTLEGAWDISDDGLTIVGNGWNPDGIREAWIAVLPEPCSDTFDNDSDGLIDYPDDPGCFSASAPSETTACDDGLDNDGDGFCDMPTSTCTQPGVTPGDTWCDAGWDDSENSCGLGFELALLLPPLMWLRGRRRRRLGPSRSPAPCRVTGQP
jgi:uncharacterized membrane protein